MTSNEFNIYIEECVKKVLIEHVKFDKDPLGINKDKSYPATKEINSIHRCRGCGSTDSKERCDEHEKSTGYWCDYCYINVYPYRKNKHNYRDTGKIGK